MIEQARDILELLSADPKVRQMARIREEGEFLSRVELTEARKEGKAEGEAIGEAKGRRDVLFRLLGRAGISLAPEQRKQIGLDHNSGQGGLATFMKRERRVTRTQSRYLGDSAGGSFVRSTSSRRLPRLA